MFHSSKRRFFSESAVALLIAGQLLLIGSAQAKKNDPEVDF
jgi:hypothetical protein